MISNGGFSIIALFGCTLRMTTSASDCMMNFEYHSSDNNERIDETMYGSSLPLTKTADAPAALVLMSFPTMKSKCGCPCCVLATP